MNADGFVLDVSAKTAEFAVTLLARMSPAAAGEDDLSGRVQTEAPRLRGSPAQEQRGPQGPEAGRLAEGPGVPTQEGLAGRRPTPPLLLHGAVQEAADAADASSFSRGGPGGPGPQPEARPRRRARHACQRADRTQLGAEQERPRGRQRPLTGSERRLTRAWRGEGGGGETGERSGRPRNYEQSHGDPQTVGKRFRSFQPPDLLQLE